jgi:hypothetical protein
MRLISALFAPLVPLAILAAPALAGDAAQPANSAPPDWSVVKAATAAIDVIGPGGTSLRRTYGVALGEPSRLVLRLTDLAGAEKIIATFRDGRKVTSTATYASDPIQDIAVLETTESLPVSPEPALAIKWRLNAKVLILPGPGMPDSAQTLTVTEPFEQGKVRVVPLSGNVSGGLPVMDVQGKWIGLTGRLEDASGVFNFLTSSEQIAPILFAEPGGKPIAQLAVTPPDWQSPREALGMLVRGVLLTYQRPAEAPPFFDLALQRDRTMPDIYFWMGKNAFKQQKYVDAEADFRETIRLKPDYTAAYHMAGAAANQQGHYDVALELYDQGLKVNPNNAMTLTNKAGALYNLGRLQESIEILKKAIQIDPTYALAVHNLGVTYAAMGNRIDAEAMYEQLKPLDKYLAKSLHDRIEGK